MKSNEKYAIDPENVEILSALLTKGGWQNWSVVETPDLDGRAPSNRLILAAETRSEIEILRTPNILVTGIEPLVETGESNSRYQVEIPHWIRFAESNAKAKKAEVALSSYKIVGRQLFAYAPGAKCAGASLILTPEFQKGGAVQMDASFDRVLRLGSKNLGFGMHRCRYR